MTRAQGIVRRRVRRGHSIGRIPGSGKGFPVTDTGKRGSGPPDPRLVPEGYRVTPWPSCSPPPVVEPVVAAFAAGDVSADWSCA
ncbi:hypothetical protein SRB5_38840 [Streptomyces sp. RB5]|uniref:Uncharacterized protein n=1 Tax=Streptomyces smaragdinus TaxID=2585196 RepID=A0A7K0CKG7_9ACTN|nr:hypothetical protein [Streptomyces smaragdinus]